jgi:hypothetical protein
VSKKGAHLLFLTKTMPKLINEQLTELAAQINAFLDMKEISLQDVNYFGLSRSTISKIFARYPEASTKTVETIRAYIANYKDNNFEQFQRKVSYDEFYGAVCNFFKIETDYFPESFFGHYSYFRLGKDEGSIIHARLNIYKSGKAVCFQSISNQSFETRAKNYIHDGFVFFLNSRFYFLGLGQDVDGAYMRPMIAKVVDNPRTQIINGMLLTEKANVKGPMASKIVLMQSDLEKKKEKELKDEQKFKEFLIKNLQNQSTTKNILYGWDEQD